jgi:hypothetical protein
MAGQGRAGLLRWSSAKKKRPVWFATHQGFLGNREREPKGSPEPANRRRIPTVALFTAAEKMEMRRSRRVLVGKELPGGTKEDARHDLAHQHGG